MPISVIPPNSIYGAITNSSPNLDSQNKIKINQEIATSAKQSETAEEMNKYIEENISIKNIDMQATNAALDSQILTYIIFPIAKSEDVSTRLIGQIKTNLNYIEKTRPDISKSNWDFTFVDGKFEIKSSKLSENDKAWLANTLNSNAVLLKSAAEFTQLATLHFETSKENFSRNSYNDYLKENKIQIYYDVKNQLSENLYFKDFFKKITDVGNEMNKNVVRTKGDVYFSNIGKFSLDIVEATSLIQGKEGIGPEIKYLPVDEAKQKAVPRSAPNTALLAQLYQTVGEQTGE